MNVILLVCLVLIIFGLMSGTLMLWSTRSHDKTDQTNDIPYLSIVIPVRNEAANLPILLQSLKQQSWTHFEIIVVDDDSEDETKTVALNHGVRLLENEETNQSIPGKSAACALGAQDAKGQWLMFLDADIKFLNQDSLKSILNSYACQKGHGILSIQPYHQIKKTYENLSAIFNLIVVVGTNVFTFWKNKFKTAGAFGPCILCDKKSYLLSGGHAAIKEAIMDDFALSENFLKIGLPVTNHRGKARLGFRMYPHGVYQLHEGWTKNLATASQSTHGAVMFLINIWILAAIVATFLPVLAIINGDITYIILSSLFYLIYGCHVFYLIRKVGNFSGWICLLYPFLFLYFVITFSYSLYRTYVLRTVTWKGRKIKL